MAQRVLYQRIVVIGTNGTIAPQGRELHQRSVFLSWFRGKLELGISADIECREPACRHSF